MWEWWKQITAKGNPFTRWDPVVICQLSALAKLYKILCVASLLESSGQKGKPSHVVLPSLENLPASISHLHLRHSP